MHLIHLKLTGSLVVLTDYVILFVLPCGGVSCNPTFGQWFCVCVCVLAGMLDRSEVRSARHKEASESRADGSNYLMQSVLTSSDNHLAPCCSCPPTPLVSS
ncbi:hypothetical protein QBC41DRAFT_320863 [Cercophora samala]|uniref:Secreted protein n=1 Tax=Cercophora samala TaxID=330535 RepID=A0AA39ZE86_9PEZI|nr:hypothetical protein QBC41DRAFT_320863 [Cercophora samala]